MRGAATPREDTSQAKGFASTPCGVIFAIYGRIKMDISNKLVENVKMKMRAYEKSSIDQKAAAGIALEDSVEGLSEKQVQQLLRMMLRI